MSASPTRVFISYSHDSDQHRALVLSLANQLRADGLDCQIDQYVNGFPPEGWQSWMENHIEAADFVLLVCTPTYLRRYRGKARDGGRGVTFEGVVISQSLYDHFYHNTRFVPLLPEGGAMDDVPLPLKPFGAFHVMAEYERLYRFLTRQPEVGMPALGDKRELPANPHPNPSPKLGEGLKRGNAGGSAANVGQEGKLGMSDTMKAAWVGAVFVVLAAVITGLFTLFAGGDIEPSGNCALANTGEISGNINQVCEEK